jgi:hypothetical protein
MKPLGLIKSLTDQGYCAKCKATGLVHNISYDLYYPRETAFSAYIYSQLAVKMNDQSCLIKAGECFKTVSKIAEKDIRLLVEPVIYPRQVDFKSGSLPGTILVVFALSKTQPYVSESINFDLTSLIMKAYNGEGGFSHDIKRDVDLPVILNTSAMALWYLSYKKTEKDIRQKAIDKILRSQHHNGAWPYVAPSKIDTLCYKILSSSTVAKKISLKLFRDRSPFFIDYLHHVVTLYYFCQSLTSSEELSEYTKSIDSAIDFAVKPLFEKKENGQLCLDFEPNLSFIRHCNMKDSSAIFYLLNCLSYLRKKCYVSQSQNLDFLFMLVKNYIDEKLINEEISPYLTNDNKFIMNRPAESHYDKSFLYLDALNDV